MNRYIFLKDKVTPKRRYINNSYYIGQILYKISDSARPSWPLKIRIDGPLSLNNLVKCAIITKSEVKNDETNQDFALDNLKVYYE